MKRILGILTLITHLACPLALAQEEETPIHVLEVEHFQYRSGNETGIYWQARIDGYVDDISMGLVIGQKGQTNWQEVKVNFCDIKETITEADANIWFCSGRIDGYIHQPEKYSIAGYYYDHQTDQEFWDNNEGQDYNMSGPFAR